MSISCPFCNPNPDRVFLVRPRLLGIWDSYPVSTGHALIVPTRHIPDLASASTEERQGLWDLVDSVMKVIVNQHGPVDGFNVGINAGEAAGQTVPHLHMHIIPRRRGDVADPSGGVRYVIPDKANYLVVKAAIAAASAPAIVADTATPATQQPAEPFLDLLAGLTPGDGTPSALSEQPLVFDVAPSLAISAPSEPAADDQIRFLTHLQCLLDGGQFTATYKYALLLAIADLAVEQGRDDTSQLALSTEAIAEKFIEYYWNQCRPFASPAPATTEPAKQKLEKVLSLLVPVYGQVGGNLPALRANTAECTKLLKSVRTVVQSTPLWKLQTIVDTQMDFLYPSVGRGSVITLRPGIAFCLRRFHGLVGNLVRGAWVDWVRSQKSGLGGDAADLREFLFGPQQRRLRDVAPALYELQGGRCFYTGKDLSHPDQAEVDHFIPFARYPHDFAHNLVLASKRANADKSDHLAAEDHLAAWVERNATVGPALGDACVAAGIASDRERTLAIARWAYTQAERAEMPAWIDGSELARRLSGRWREILGVAATSAST